MMALIKCPKCGTAVIAKAKGCSRCNPFASSSCGASSTMIVIVVAVLVVFGLIVLTCAGS